MPPKKAVKIPVFTQYGRIEMADAARVRQLQNAANAEFVIRHKDGCLVQIMLYPHGDDYARRSRRSNPQTDVYDAESAENPRGVWTFKRGCGSAAADPHS